MKRGVNQTFLASPPSCGRHHKFSTPFRLGFGIYEDNFHMHAAVQVW
jgi:hypothetical protein